MDLQLFLKSTTIFRYNNDEFTKIKVTDINQLTPIKRENFVQWINTYKNIRNEYLKNIIAQNSLDDFLIKLLFGQYTNKVIELNDVLFVSIEVLGMENNILTSEKMAFILNNHFIWSLQEKFGDYFEWIRERLQSKNGLVRYKKADYLFFLMLDLIIDNYEQTLQKISEYNDLLFTSSKIKPTPEFTAKIEERKQEMFKFKKATKTLRDTITKLEKVQLSAFKTKYFNELKEQTNNLMSDVDFELQELESKINLVFSIQGHHLNEVMKTLTVFSIIFTPITFLAGVYGMNFSNMPELKTQYGYFALLGAMLCISVIIIFYFKRKKWF